MSSLRAIYIGRNLFYGNKSPLMHTKVGTLPSEENLLAMQWYPEFVIVFHPELMYIEIRNMYRCDVFSGLKCCPAFSLY